MAKAINWPEKFYDEIMAEDIDKPKIAIRIGSLYFDNGYYVNGEIVDIRVNHKIVRKGQIVEEMRITKIKDLSQNDIEMYKSTLQRKSDIIGFLSANYNQHIDEENIVTVITYKNFAIKEGETHEDPHIR